MSGGDRERPARAALVVEGGAMRGVFAAGVLDAFLERGLDPFDLYIGASAGACNLASHLAAQHGRNRALYTDYSCRPEFVSWRRFLAGGHLLDLDWMWEITIREYRLDLERIYSGDRRFVVVVTDVHTGEAVYAEPTADTLEDYLKASSSLPYLYRHFHELDGRTVADGGIADSIPVEEAHRRGARTIVAVCSRPADHVKRSGVETLAFSWAFRRYPRLAAAMRRRADRYNASLAFIRHPPPGVRVLQVAPPTDLPLGRFTRDPATLERAYRVGR
ncbi:MAG: patatin family protein [Deltaproteobacteria bacterium]|jgi:predicted patatin/cPLA2 family phospholipase|nr:patatin family protein [Deltaproteobacteria bacterium]